MGLNTGAWAANGDSNDVCNNLCKNSMAIVEDEGLQGVKSENDNDDIYYTGLIISHGPNKSEW